jgi:virulence factor Mce-like protein
MLTGSIALLLLIAIMSVGVKAAFGAYAGGYRLTGSFEAAGQGLLPGSDVKIRGVNVGSVRNIKLVDGRALVTVRIHDGERVPRATVARIRAKTLFGEKFVDLDLSDANEAKGPFLGPGDRFEHTEGGFELEQVLDEVYPLLKSIDPSELMTVVSELTMGGRGLGEEINRTIVHGSQVSDVFAAHNDDTAKFLRDLAALSGQLATSAGDLVGIADAGNEALPILNDHEADLVTILTQTGRLSNDVADLLLHNKPFVDASLGDGSKAVQILYDRRTMVVPLVIGLREYLQSLTEILRIDVGDGTLMAAVKGLLGTQVCGLVPCTGDTGSAAASLGRAPTSAPASTTAPTTAPTVAPPGSAPQDDISDLLRRVLGA